MVFGLLKRRGEVMTKDDVGGKMAEVRTEIGARQAAIAGLRSEREAAQALLDEHRIGERLQDGDRSEDIAQLRQKIGDMDRKLAEEAETLAEDRRVLDGLERPLLAAEFVTVQARYVEEMARQDALRGAGHDAFRAWLEAARDFHAWRDGARTIAGDRNSIARQLGEAEARTPRDQLLPGSLTYVSDAVLHGFERHARIYGLALEEFDRRLENMHRLERGG